MYELTHTSNKVHDDEVPTTKLFNDCRPASVGSDYPQNGSRDKRWHRWPIWNTSIKSTHDTDPKIESPEETW
jgi:hypothetical protein